MTDRQISTRPVDPDGTVDAPVRSLGLDRNPFVGSGPLATLPQQAESLTTIRSWIDGVRTDRDRSDRLAVLTGEPGMGKSRLMREIVAREGITAPLIDPGKGGLTDAHLLRAIVDAFGGTATGRTGMDLRRDIRLALADLPSNTAPGLLIDDADFSGARLELIRNVLRDGAGHGLWIVLAGQPDLADRVARRRSLRAILGPVATIEHADPGSMREIIAARLDAAMSRGRSPLTPDAIEAIVEGAAGNPGHLLRIAEIAVGIAARQGLDTVTAPVVLAAMHGLDNAPDASRQPGGAFAVQSEFPLLSDGGSAGSGGTTQRSLWDGEGT